MISTEGAAREGRVDGHGGRGNEPGAASEGVAVPRMTAAAEGLLLLRRSVPLHLLQGQCRVAAHSDKYAPLLLVGALLHFRLLI